MGGKTIVGLDGRNPTQNPSSCTHTAPRARGTPSCLHKHHDIDAHLTC
jgi:hypothetical protein